MELRALTETYAVSPQIDPEDVAAIKAAGFTTIICNRPDAENPPSHQAAAIRAAAEAAGLSFVENPYSPAAFDWSLVETQRTAIENAGGPVFAYCASGNRSSVLWGLGEAAKGTMTAEEITGAATRAGYDHGRMADDYASLIARR